MDAAAIGDLTVTAYIDGEHLPEGSPYESTLRDVMSRLEHTIAAVDGEQIVGAVTVTPPGHALTSLAEADEWEVRFLAVRSELWGRGIGERILTAAEQRARAAGAQAIALRVIDINTRGHAFYTRLGYERIPERDWSPPSNPPVLLKAYRRALDTLST